MMRPVYLGFLPSLIASLALAESPPFATDGVTVAAIVESWQVRERELDSCVIEWTEHRVYRPGSLMPPRHPHAESLPHDLRGVGIPKKQAEFDIAASLKLKGDWLYFDTNLPRITESFGVELAPYTSSYDGQSSGYLFKWAVPSPGHYPTGSIRNEARNTDAPSYPLRPLLYFLRPFDRSMTGLSPAQLVITNKDVDLAGTSCVVIRHEFDELWVSRTPPFVVLRWRAYHPRGRLVLQADISYARDAAQGRVLPTGWKLERYVADGSGMVDESIIASALSIGMGVPLAREDFELNFPSGSRIYDQTRAEEFIVREDGTRRIIRPHELAKPHPELLSDADGPPAGSSASWRLLVGVNCILLALVAAVWYMVSRPVGSR